ncbi:AAA family ATPase [Streptomyces sp. NPDC058659]|uniref:AAA family ATPase n=1 Tax=unclassified Streptomyces TaxID=2593676 RepID=UPI003661B9F0
MYLGRVRAKGFKSLLDTDVALRPGVTVVVGENNAGKSNFIDVLRLLTDHDGQYRGRPGGPGRLFPRPPGAGRSGGGQAGQRERGTASGHAGGCRQRELSTYPTARGPRVRRRARAAVTRPGADLHALDLNVYGRRHSLIPNRDGFGAGERQCRSGVTAPALAVLTGRK